MQVAFVVILAAAGLGCHNKPGDAFDGNGVSSYQLDSPSLLSQQGAAFFDQHQLFCPNAVSRDPFTRLRQLFAASLGRLAH